MKQIIGIALLAVMAGSVSADVVWSEDFEGAVLGATSGNNQNLAGTVIQTANTAASIVTNAPAAFTLGSGNVILLSTGVNAFTALRPNSDNNPINFISTYASTDTYTMSFDIYIPTTLTKAVGDFQPRFKLDGVGGNGATDASQTESAMGQYHIVYTGPVSDFIATSIDEARPFIGIDQDGVAAANYMYMDNLVLDVSVIPEPATFGLIAVFGGAVLFIRRHFKV